MSLVIRSMRMGKKGERKFRVIVKEKRDRRDGNFVELLGWYEKNKPEYKKEINIERYNYWVSKGAQPSQVVSTLVVDKK